MILKCDWVIVIDVDGVPCHGDMMSVKNRYILNGSRFVGCGWWGGGDLVPYHSHRGDAPKWCDWQRSGHLTQWRQMVWDSAGWGWCGMGRLIVDWCGLLCNYSAPWPDGRGWSRCATSTVWEGTSTTSPYLQPLNGTGSSGLAPSIGYCCLEDVVGL